MTPEAQPTADLDTAEQTVVEQAAIAQPVAEPPVAEQPPMLLKDRIYNIIASAPGGSITMTDLVTELNRQTGQTRDRSSVGGSLYGMVDEGRVISRVEGAGPKRLATLSIPKPGEAPPPKPKKKRKPVAALDADARALTSERKRLEKERAKLDALQESEEPSTQEIAGTPATLPVALQHAVAVGGLATELKGIADAVGAFLGAALGPLIKDVVAQQITAAMAAARQAVEQELTLPAQKPGVSLVAKYGTPPKPKVIIVGLIDKQVGMIEREYNSRLTISYCPAKHVTRMKNMDLAGKPIFVMTGFIGHDTTEMIKARGGKPIMVNGGLTDLRNQLDKLYAVQTESLREKRAA